MNFVSLVSHGLSAISVYSETVGVRLLVASSMLIVLILFGLVGVVFFVGQTAQIPLWLILTAGIFLNLLLQAILFSFVFSCAMLAARNHATFVPIRDYQYFVRQVCLLQDQAAEESD